MMVIIMPEKMFLACVIEKEKRCDSQFAVYKHRSDALGLQANLRDKTRVICRLTRIKVTFGLEKGIGNGLIRWQKAGHWRLGRRLRGKDTWDWKVNQWMTAFIKYVT